MSNIINELVQDANVLLTTARKYQTQLTEFGVTADEIQQLETLIGTLESKDAAHKEAQNQKKQKTKAQVDLLLRSQEIIKKVKTAAKAVFYRDEVILKEFHIGTKPPVTVSAALNELIYMQEVATRYASQLQTRGIKSTDLEEITACHSLLANADSEQENAKRSQTTAWNERKATVDDLKAVMFRIRRSAELCFGKDKSTLNEFRSIIRTSRTKKPATPPPAGENP